MKTIYRIIVALLVSAFISTGCASAVDPEPAESMSEESLGLANPASVNCEEKGGTVVIQKRGDGGEYGVCVFPENRQCEEWAMYNGDCPEGGIDTTDYVTAAALYCAISGGEYTVTDKSGLEDEQGECKFKNGNTCDVWDFYNGTCDSN